MEGKVYKRECSHEEWLEFIKAMQSGKEFEVDEEMFYYWLEVLPPVFMNKEMTFTPFDEQNRDKRKVRASFGFAEGAEPITVFWVKDGRYYGQRTNTINRRG